MSCNFWFGLTQLHYVIPKHTPWLLQFSTISKKKSLTHSLLADFNTEWPWTCHMPSKLAHQESEHNLTSLKLYAQHTVKFRSSVWISEWTLPTLQGQSETTKVCKIESVMINNLPSDKAGFLQQMKKKTV